MIGVMLRYNDKEELNRAGADYIINDPSESVKILADYSIPVSVYNHQLCLINEDTHPYYVHSISDWKKEYLDECAECSKKQECGGFFSSQVKYKFSNKIKAYK